MDQAKVAAQVGEERFLVVGIGASAGGIEALRRFLAEVGLGPGYALILVQPMGEAETLLLAETLSRLSPLPVTELVDGMTIERDRLYIAPPKLVVSFKEGRCRLRPPRAGAERRASIDRAFQALADAFETRSVAVVLSGLGADGALGFSAVGAAGGMTMAQAPETASAQEMPASVTAIADHVQEPASLAQTLNAYARHWLAATAGHPAEERREELQARLPEICDILLRRTGHSFKHYKSSTLLRRLERRMQVLQIDTVPAYVGHLGRDLQEPHTLFRELLIGITSFFREPDAFTALAERAIAGLLTKRAESDTLRIWVPGCATGEEAYSIAMLVREQLDGLPATPKVQIFATDVNERALSTARRGSYPQGIAAHVSPERLSRFFVKKGRRYQVNDEIREMCLFSVHNLISDPPFSRLDLISCRNLLIYLGSHLQKKLIPVFHYALRSGGYLFLGASESLTGHSELFRVVDAKHRLAQRKDTAIHPPGSLRERGGSVGLSLRDPSFAQDADLGAVAQRILLDEFAPKYVIVTEDGQVVYLSEGVDVFIQAPAGSFSNNIIRMVRRGMSVGLRTAFSQATRTKRMVTREIPAVHTAEGLRAVRLTVQPMPDLGREDGLYMLVFQDRGPALRRTNDEEQALGPEADLVIESLERELLRTREDLERTVQELEAANEELKSSNEELLSMNEELQSSNEELETSKEEVHAANQALAAANADLENLLRSTRIATIFLDREGAIRSFTPAAAEIYNITPGDVGRPLDHFTHRLTGLPPLPSAGELQAESEVAEAEATAADGRVFVRRVVPYRTQDGEVAGIVATFIDVTRQKRTETILQAVERRQSFLLALNDRLRTLEDPYAIMQASTEAVGRHFGVSRVGYGEVDPQSVHVIVDRDWTDGTVGSIVGPHRMEDFGPPLIDTLREGGTIAVEDVATDERTRDGHEAFAAIQTRSVLAVPLCKGGRMTAMLYLHHRAARRWSSEDFALIEDVAERTWAAVERARVEAELRESEARFRTIAEALPALVWITDPAVQVTYVNQRWSEYTGLTEAESLGEGWRAVVHPDDLPRVSEAWAEAKLNQSSLMTEVRYRAGDGRYRWHLARAEPARAHSGRFLGWLGASVDIEEKRQAEEALARNAERLRLALQAARMGDWSYDAASGLVTLSEPAARIFDLRPGPIERADIRARIQPQDAERNKLAFDEAIRNGTHYTFEYRVRRAPEGRDLWVASEAQPVLDEARRVVGMIGVVQDVSERKQAEERQLLLIRELHHRVKNTLATVQAIVGSTARSTSSVEEFFEGFVGRIVSLAHTHSLLTDDAWQTALLRDLLTSELKPYEDQDRARVRLDGPEVELTSDSAVPIGMAIHELTTNAAKHGALSTSRGRVEVAWTVDGADDSRRLVLDWIEKDGPPVTAPQRQGFGSRLLQRVLTAQLQAEVKPDWRPEGLHLRLTVPLPKPSSILLNPA